MFAQMMSQFFHEFQGKKVEEVAPQIAALVAKISMTVAAEMAAALSEPEKREIGFLAAQ